MLNSSDIVILREAKDLLVAAESKSLASLRMTKLERVVWCFVSGHRFSDAASHAKSAAPLGAAVAADA